MFGLRVLSTSEVMLRVVSEIQFVAVTRFMTGVEPAPGMERLLVFVSDHMPVRVRARQPCRQQGNTGFM